MSRRTFTATLEEGRGGGAFVEIPFDVATTFGTRGRVPIKATFDGESYRGSIAPMGGRHVLGVTKAIRRTIGKAIGDSIRVTVEADLEPRTVTVPPDFAAALARSKRIAQAFDGLSYTHRKEFVEWIDGAKKPETRARRISRALGMLRERRTR